METDRRYMTAAQADAALIDVGLRQHMLRVYNYMALGLVITGLVALMVSAIPALYAAIFSTPRCRYPMTQIPHLPPTRLTISRVATLGPPGISRFLGRMHVPSRKHIHLNRTP